jgi:centractin
MIIPFRFVGSRAEEHRGALLLSYPMENGIVRNWADMERIWSYVYSRENLNVASNEHAVGNYCLQVLL